MFKEMLSMIISEKRKLTQSQKPRYSSYVNTQYIYIYM